MPLLFDLKYTFCFLFTWYFILDSQTFRTVESFMANTYTPRICREICYTWLITYLSIKLSHFLDTFVLISKWQTSLTLSPKYTLCWNRALAVCSPARVSLTSFSMLFFGSGEASTYWQWVCRCLPSAAKVRILRNQVKRI